MRRRSAKCLPDPGRGSRAPIHYVNLDGQDDAGRCSSGDHGGGRQRRRPLGGPRGMQPQPRRRRLAVSISWGERFGSRPFR